MTLALLDYAWLYYYTYNGSIWLAFTLQHYSMPLRDSTMDLLGCTWLKYTACYWRVATCVYLTLQHRIMTLLGSHWLYCTLKWFYLTLPDSTTLCHGCTCLYFTPLYFTMALHGSTWHGCRIVTRPLFLRVRGGVWALDYNRTWRNGLVSKIICSS